LGALSIFGLVKDREFIFSTFIEHNNCYQSHDKLPWAPARGEQGGQAPTLENIRVGMAYRGNFSRGLKTENELILVAHSVRPVDLDGVIEDFVRLNDQRKDDFGL